MSHLVTSKTVGGDHELGGKARALADLSGAGFPVPPWLVVTPGAFAASLTDSRRAALESAGDDQGFRAALEGLELALPIRRELEAPLGELAGQGETFAVRSSAVEEDSARHSFAGQLESFLFVAPPDVPGKIVAVWKSAFTARVLAYRRHHNLDPLLSTPAVLIQRMINAEVSGVAFSADPVTGRRGVAVVTSLYGLGTALVSGDSNADTHHVDRDGRVIACTIAEKVVAQRLGDGGLAWIPVAGSDARRPALSEAQVRAIAALVRAAERFQGRPQDVEWALEKGTLYLLQSRPITSLAALADPDGGRAVWDNSNIAESYSGITTPLTFSFARHAYEGVYRQFCRTLRVPPRRMEENDSIFATMIGCIRGRIYYNLRNWYRLLAMLPGYQVNRGFMEQMMGVKERLPQATGTTPLPGRRDRIRDSLALLAMMVGVVAKHLILKKTIRRFLRRVDAALGPERPDLSRCRPDELVALYRELEKKLLTRWDAPIINDFSTMIFVGLLRRMCNPWGGDRGGALVNELLRGTDGMVSTEPARLIGEMARLAAEDPRLADLLRRGELRDILVELPRHDEFRARYLAYLRHFGDRCVNELKLESPTLHEDPLPLLRAVGSLAERQPSAEPLKSTPVPDGVTARDKAERRFDFRMTRRPVRRLLFRWILNNARARVRDRENLRFERTRVFGRVRMVFVELGRRLYGLDLLEAPRDIFFLEVQEILGFVEGTSTCTDLKGLVRLRRGEFEAYSHMEAPGERFETQGIVYQGNTFRSTRTAAAPK
ncbi:MAG TPA: PEP/pyruvate-binding domain-containing protein, partial [Syntrophobacteria bacterium]|nr:PEP/pyruvate-binding domain-containing protein [Syntrophobacteria bacterium]